MATVPFGVQTNNVASGDFGKAGKSGMRKVLLTNAADVSDWIPVNGSCNVLVSGGTTFTVEVYRATETGQADSVLVDNQTETDRTGLYDFVGPGWLLVKLTAVTGGPVTARVTQ